MPRAFSVYAKAGLGLFSIAALQLSMLAQSQEASPEKLAAVASAYEELRRQNPELPERSAEQLAEDVKTIDRALRDHAPDAESTLVQSVRGSVAASTRCKEGYVRDGRHEASDPSVAIVSEELRDCDAVGCRAYEVSALSERPEPFDLDVSVTCSN